MDKVEMVKLMAEMFHSFANSLLASIATDDMFDYLGIA